MPLPTRSSLTILGRLAVCTVAALCSSAAAQIVERGSFNPSTAGSLCGLGQDPETATVWVYPCSGAEVLGFSPDGDPLATVSRPGEAANDVDVMFAPESIVLGESTLPAGTLLFVNGESGPAEIYAVDTATGAVLDTLATAFGTSHVVGGAYHPIRNTFFLVQDNVPGPADENRVAEVDPVSGDTLQTFPIGASFNVSYGDLDVSGVTGNLFVVSSAENGIAEFTPDGAFVEEHALPAGVNSLSGIALDCSASEAWVSDRSGAVYHLGQVPCGSSTRLEGRPSDALSLSTARPNPYRDRASLVLRVERSQHVRVAVYDALGREVELVLDEPVGPGERVLTLGGELPGGLYLVRAVGERAAATGRLVRLD